MTTPHDTDYADDQDTDVRNTPPPQTGNPAADQHEFHEGLVDLDLDVKPRKQRKAFGVRLGGRLWTIQPPDGGLVMELEEARTTRGALSLMFDDQWPEVSPLLDTVEDPADLTKLIRQYARHFEIDMEAMATQSAPNRSERRRLRRKS